MDNRSIDSVSGLADVFRDICLTQAKVCVTEVKCECGEIHRVPLDGFRICQCGRKIVSPLLDN